MTALSFRQFSRILSQPQFPVQVAVGLVVGYALSRRFDGLLTPWVWTLPLLVLLVRFFLFTPGIFEGAWKARIDHFFGDGCRPLPLYCFDQMTYTAPLYTSLAYSLGAWLRRIGWFRFPSNGQT